MIVQSRRLPFPLTRLGQMPEESLPVACGPYTLLREPSQRGYHLYPFQDNQTPQSVLANSLFFQGGYDIGNRSLDKILRRELVIGDPPPLAMPHQKLIAFFVNFLAQRRS